MDRHLGQPENTEPNPWPELLAGYVLGDLSPEDVIAVKQYLEIHPEAIAEVESLQQALALIPLGLPNAAPPRELKQRVLAAAQADLQEDLTQNLPTERELGAAVMNIAQPQTSTQQRAQKRWFAMAGGIAAATIAAFGIQSYQLQQELKATRQEIAQMRQTQEKLIATQGDLNRYQQAVATIEQAPGRMLNLAGSGIAASASGNVVITPSQRQAVLMIQNMPKPPEGKVYHLWAMVEGRKVACIQFTPEADGKVLMQLPADRWVNAIGVAVTLEPNQSEVQPTGDMVMNTVQL
jgi:anti-sigma factor RsiW